MKLNQIYRVRVVENPKIKFDSDGNLTFIPSKGSKSYETFMIYQSKDYFRDFDNNFYIYCKSVKDYIERDNFQNNKNILDYVSVLSLADELRIDGDTDIDYVIIKSVLTKYINKKITMEQVKDVLAKAVEIQNEK